MADEYPYLVGSLNNWSGVARPPIGLYSCSIMKIVGDLHSIVPLHRSFNKLRIFSQDRGYQAIGLAFRCKAALAFLGAEW